MQKFYTMTIAPPCLILLLYGIFKWQVRSLTEDDPVRHRTFDRFLEITFTFIFLIFPVVCQCIFQVLLCQDFGDLGVDEVQSERYLAVDFQVDCNSPEYTTMMGIAVIMVLVYPVGIPATIVVTLLNERSQLVVEGSEMRDYMDPLVGVYRVDCYYWEALEMTRKVVLTGLMVYWAPGTVQQLLLGATISVIYMGAAILKQPYQSPFNNRFKIVTDGAILFTFNVAVLLSPHVNDPDAAGGFTLFYIERGHLEIMLFVVNFLIPLALVGHEVKRMVGHYYVEKKADQTAEEEQGTSEGAADVGKRRPEKPTRKGLTTRNTSNPKVDGEMAVFQNPLDDDDDQKDNAAPETPVNSKPSSFEQDGDDTGGQSLSAQPHVDG
jgi:hypothetical protein